MLQIIKIYKKPFIFLFFCSHLEHHDYRRGCRCCNKHWFGGWISRLSKSNWVGLFSDFTGGTPSQTLTAIDACRFRYNSNSSFDSNDLYPSELNWAFPASAVHKLISITSRASDWEFHSWYIVRISLTWPCIHRNISRYSGFLISCISLSEGENVNKFFIAYILSLRVKLLPFLFFLGWNLFVVMSYAHFKMST